MAVELQTIEKGAMNWHIPMNANLEAIQQGFADIDAQAGQADVFTTLQAFYALTQAQISTMFMQGTRRIYATNTEKVSGKRVPCECFIITSDGSYYPYSGIKAPLYGYEGKDLSTVFASLAEMHNAVSAGDFSRINVGDYWPITLNGNYTDCGENTTKNLANAAVKLEVAGIDTYINYGDTPVTVHHLVMCSRDCLPNTTKWRSANTTWYNTSKTNPWLGSAVYATLNVGILPLLNAAGMSGYIFAGPNGNGMRFLGETKAANATSATGWAWEDRGKLFLPMEREVWGQDVWSEHGYGGGLAVQWPIFTDGLRHIVKGLGDAGSRCSWWLGSSHSGNASNACNVANHGHPSYYSASNALGIPVCFLFA